MKPQGIKSKTTLVQIFVVSLLMITCSIKERPGEAKTNDSIQSSELDSVIVKTGIKSNSHHLIDYYNILIDSITQVVEDDGGGGDHTHFRYILKEFKNYKLIEWEDFSYNVSLDKRTYLYKSDSLLAVLAGKKDEYNSLYVESLEQFKDGRVTTVERSINGASINIYSIVLDSVELKKTPYQERTNAGYAGQYYPKFKEQVLYYKHLIDNWNSSLQEQTPDDSI